MRLYGVSPLMIAAMVGFLVLLNTAAQADKIVLQQGLNGYTGTSDTTIFQELAANSAGGFPWMYAGMTQFGNTRRALLKFDLLDKVPPGAVINTVSVQLYVDRARFGAVSCGLHRLTRPWNEGNNQVPAGTEGGVGAAAQAGDTTWSHVNYSTVPWATSGGEFLATASGSGTASDVGTTLTLAGAGLTQDVQSWLANPADNHGWILLAGESGIWNAKRFVSSESTDVHKPRLEIEFTAASCVSDWDLYE